MKKYLYRISLYIRVFCVVFKKTTTSAQVNTTAITAIHSFGGASRWISSAMVRAANACSLASFQFHLVMAW